MLSVGYYRPDLAETNPGVSLTVRNAIIQADAQGVAYGPHPSLTALATSDALPDNPRGTISVVTRAGQYQSFVGTASKLYKISAAGAVTQIGSGYAVPSGDNWSFAQFGDYLYATNTFDGMVRYNIESGGTVDAVSGAPKARFIFPLFGTLAALDCDGNNRVMKTSAINNGALWSGDASNTYQEFVGGEELIAGGELGSQYAVVFQRNAIRVLTRTRDRSIFTADLLVDGVGAQGADGCVFTRGWAYFVDTDGFQRTNGQTVDPIGRNKVSKTFIKSLASNALTSVQGAFDPATLRVIWRYRDAANNDAAVFNKALAFDIIGTQEWVPIEIDTAALVTMASPGYSLDDLDQFGTLDTLPYSLDDRAWKGGEPRLAGFDGDLKFGFVSGPSLACTLETGAQLTSVVQRLQWCTPITDASDCTVQVGYKDHPSQSFTWGPAKSLTASKRAKIANGAGRGRIYALRFNEAAAGVWTFMRGFDGIEGVTGGPKA
jgi:hypothetical protein